MNAQRCFCKVLNIKQLPPPVENAHEVASYCKSAAYNVLPVGIRFSRGGIFCVLLLGLMLSFASCGKGVKVPEPVVAEPGRSIEGPTLKNDTAPNQGVSFTIDTTWLPDTIIDFTPNP